jgi:VWFA-related protein
MRLRSKWFLGILLAAGFTTTVAFKREENSKPQKTKRVALNVIAFDQNDHVVNDLTAHDFQVTDQGKPQPIASFEHNEQPAPVAILFDLLNDGAGAQGYGAQEIARALQHLGSSDSLYFYLLTREANLRVVRAVPAPGVEVEAGQNNVPWTQRIGPLLDAIMNSVAGLRQQDIDNISATHGAIKALGSMMAPIPGRKYILWISRGIPLSFRRNDTSPIVDQAARALDDEGVTLDSVDQGSSVSGTSGTFEEFAKITGGKTYYNEFDKALSEVMNASRSNYIIQFDAAKLDGKYHKVRVTSSRKGVRLQVKQGYYAE